MDDGNKLRELMANEEYKKVAIIGAGFIGLEAVEAAKHRGKELLLFNFKTEFFKKYLIKIR